jgi:hypothetical protein
MDFSPVHKIHWRRDARMMAMCLRITGHTDLIGTWAVSLTDPYDRNNNGEQEADKLEFNN